MTMEAVKGIPYGVARFEQVRKENSYYVDKTMYLPQLEEMNNYLFLIRPRRFGKSVFVSMMQDYYDMAKADEFDTLFDGLWIKEHPTKLKNAFQVIYFDSSQVSGSEERLRPSFNSYCGAVIDGFMEKYATKEEPRCDAGHDLLCPHPPAADSGGEGTYALWERVLGEDQMFQIIGLSIKFLYVKPVLYLRLPSDHTSLRTPLPSARRLPL